MKKSSRWWFLFSFLSVWRKTKVNLCAAAVNRNLLYKKSLIDLIQQWKKSQLQSSSGQNSYY
jgi:hypothetical protein